MNAIIQPSLSGMHVPPISFCAVCHRPLTNPVSVARGTGPVCRAHQEALDVEAFQPFPSWAGRKSAPTEADKLLPPFDPTTGDILCCRSADGTPVFNIEHRQVHHSPQGMEFGYAGSGPADFALNVMALFLPARAPYAGADVRLWDGSYVSQRAWDLHQDFKREYIQHLPSGGGTIPGHIIRGWIAVRIGEVGD